MFELENHFEAMHELDLEQQKIEAHKDYINHEAKRIESHLKKCDEILKKQEE